MQEKFGLSQIGQIAVTVQDLDRAVAFYRDTLGMKFLFQVPAMAFFDCQGVRLMLSLPEGTESHISSSIIYYLVADITEAYQTLSQQEVDFSAEPHLIAKMSDHDLWMAFFKDSEANTLALMSEVPHE
jgi:methylmalonyl-CoA/ethylmalonyl-CoA epimerase